MDGCSIILPHALQYKELVYYGWLGKKEENFVGQNQLDRLEMTQFEGPRVTNPSVSSILGVGRIPLSHY